MQYRHGALDAQAVTDLISNVTSLRPAAQAEDPRPWLGWGTAGSEQLSVFWHELTHHWCFTSPVAFAIAGLVLRARLEAVRAIESDAHPKASIVVDIVRAETATALLRPLAEGLALFAEFDVISRLQSKTLSAVMKATLEFFVDPKEVAELFKSFPAQLAMTESINRTLYRMRTNPATLNRKASLLLKPFPVRAGGYLPGYLSVKSLWRAACRRDFRLANETDLFLMYLRTFLYDDWSLVATLLRPSNHEIRSAEHIVNHLNERLRRWESLTAEDVSAYEDSLLDATSFKQRPGALVNEQEALEGRQLLDELAKELNSNAGDAGIASAIASWNLSLMKRRSFMNLLSVPVQIRVARGNIPHIAWHDILIIELSRDDLIKGVSQVSGEASLEVIFTHREDRFERAVVAHRDGRVLACIPFGLKEHAAETRENVIATFVERPKLQAAETDMRAVMDQLVRESWFTVPIEHCRTQVAAVLDSFYRDIALRFARDYSSADQCAEAMATRGLKLILGGSGRLVRGLALLGLLTSLNPATDFIEREFRDAGLDLAETLADLQLAYDKHGFPPEILQPGEAIFSTI